MKLHLSRIVTSLGYTATPEHPPTRADVFVHEPAYCLEVQLRSTQFRKRTAARLAKGAQVCWFIGDNLDTDVARKAVFGLPSVRFRLVDNENPKRRVAPWDEPELEEQVCLQLFATVAYLDDETPLSFVTKATDGATFLREVLSGQRKWYRPNVLGRKCGLWALKSEVSKYFARRQGARSRGSSKL